jgi:signal transduction histidine kinase
MFNRNNLQYLFIAVAVIIAIGSVWITHTLVNELKTEERRKIEIWAESIALLSAQAISEEMETDAFNNYDRHLMHIIETNHTIPAIRTDAADHWIEDTNIKYPANNDSDFINRKIAELKQKHTPIAVKIDENTTQYVYYDDSTVLKQLQMFPFIQLSVVFIFIFIAFLALNSTQKAEQNKVWVGLSKETAHQLGTPISSLMAWLEYLKTKDADPQFLAEMDKDVQRLKIIAERFSKIGSAADTEVLNLQEAIARAIEYMGKRISSKVNILVDVPKEPIIVQMNESLFGWTLENLIKNAVDAMDGHGKIKIAAFRTDKKVVMDVSDTGKGIAKSKFKTVFQPGYTTKKRGWGLGLSLVKRIVESYQKGKIYVLKSEIGKGTTFRMEWKQ